MASQFKLWENFDPIAYEIERCGRPEDLEPNLQHMKPMKPLEELCEEESWSSGEEYPSSRWLRQRKKEEAEEAARRETTPPRALKRTRRLELPQEEPSPSATEILERLMEEEEARQRKDDLRSRVDEPGGSERVSGESGRNQEKKTDEQGENAVGRKTEAENEPADPPSPWSQPKLRRLRARCKK